MGQVSHQYLILMHLTSIIQIRTFDNIIDCQQQGINVMSFSFEVLYQQAIFLETIFFCISNSMYQKVEQPSSRTFAACIKIINLIAAGVVMASGIIGIVYMFIHNLISSRFLLIFNPIFLILFGFMMVAAEFKIRVLLKECHFLTHLFGRGVFFLYLASSVYWYFSFGTPDWTLTYVTSMTIFAIGVLYLILHCCGKTTVQKQYIV